jgi:hypothetical protein
MLIWSDNEYIIHLLAWDLALNTSSSCHFVLHDR